MKHMQYEIDLLEAEFGSGICELQDIADVEKDGYILNAVISQDGTISELAKVRNYLCLFIWCFLLSS